jgi:hypothetical protein
MLEQSAKGKNPKDTKSASSPLNVEHCVLSIEHLLSSFFIHPSLFLVQYSFLSTSSAAFPSKHNKTLQSPFYHLKQLQQKSGNPVYWQPVNTL